RHPARLEHDAINTTTTTRPKEMTTMKTRLFESKTKAVIARLAAGRKPIPFLAAALAALVLTISAAASATFILKWGGPGAGDGQFYVSGVAVGASGNVYVADLYNHRIQKFDSNGNFLAKWGTFGSGDGEFYYPYDVATDPSGNVYVVDANNHRIQKFDQNGNFLTKWGSHGSGDGEFNFPLSITVDGSGMVYVA